MPIVSPVDSDVTATVDLELRAIYKQFERVVVVDGVSLSVAKGEFISLLGPSGCGKTTILRMVAGYEQPNRGEILIGGRSVSGIPPYRRNVGMVFQSYALFPHLTVAENIAFGLKERRIPASKIRDKVREFMDLVHLNRLGERYPNQLSGGQQQRVALARALVIKPDILLLDEPLSNLDAKLREEMRIEIKQLQASLGITTVFVTHDQNEALTLSHRVVLMSNGGVQQVGTPTEVYQHPATRFAFEFLGGTNVFPGRVMKRSDDVTTFQTGSGLTITASNGKTTNADDFACLGIRPENIHFGEGRGAQVNTPNRFPAIVEESFYRGWTREVIVQLASGDRLRLVRITPREGDTRPEDEPGAEVVIEWSPEDSYLLLDH
ncbi:MAG: spermidine/putrescine import ATP-binding protein PotA [marine bacterium B5-7]|nr:MAG: spermidine/putrescine import ATP-binding protein PotA [marine bacterium B5-7]